MPTAGLLLTGGASRRMGHDKATLRIRADTPTLAYRTAALLSEATSLALEVGPGHTDLPRVLEDPPGAGPLAAVIAGRDALAVLGWTGPVLVTATDLPCLTVGLLFWLADHPSPRSVVPVADGVPQPLCARYSPGDLDLARSLSTRGSRAMRDLLAATDIWLAGPELWGPPAGDLDSLMDVDTPADLARLRGRSEPAARPHPVTRT